jgi:hypothetical protein
MNDDQQREFDFWFKAWLPPTQDYRSYAQIIGALEEAFLAGWKSRAART